MYLLTLRICLLVYRKGLGTEWKFFWTLNELCISICLQNQLQRRVDVAATKIDFRLAGDCFGFSKPIAFRESIIAENGTAVSKNNSKGPFGIPCTHYSRRRNL